MGVADAGSHRQVEVTGTLDFARASNPAAQGKGDRTQYFIIDEDGRSWELMVPPGLARQFEGQEVTVTGRPRGDGVLQVTGLDGDPEPSHVDSAQTGSKPFVTLPCKFSDVDDEPEGTAFFEQLLGDDPNGADHYWQEVSYDIIDLAGGEVQDWEDLPEPRVWDEGTGEGYIDLDDDDNQGSMLGKLATHCRDAHTDADPDLDLSDFFGVNLMFNDRLDCCAWGGMAAGQPTTWMPPWSWDLAVMAHEQGHAFGLPHSSGPFDATYDSRWDVMSNGPRPIPAHTIAFHKGKLGWIDHDRRFEWDGSDNVTVALDRIADPPSAVNPEGAGTLLAVVPIGDGTFYTAEARKFVGYDENVPGEAVVLHHVDTSRSRQAQVVVAEGGTSPNGAEAQWLPGERFEDAENDIAIEVLGETTAGFTIVINPPIVADISVDKTAIPTPAIAGTHLEYHITVSNDGPGTAREVTLTDELPQGTSFVTASGQIGAGSCSETAGTVTCDLGQISAGASRQVILTVAVDADLVASAGAPTTITNVAEVTQQEDIIDPNLADNVATLTTSVNDLADLSARKDCKPDGPLSAGDTGTCTIFVDNFGPSYARSLEVLDEIVADGAFSVVAVDPPACIVDNLFDPTKANVVCNLGNVDLGPTVRKVEVDVTADEGMDVNNTATVSSDTPDPDPGNNQASDSLEIRAEADLGLTKTAVDAVTAGQPLTYTLTVDNDGPSTAANVVVEDWLPSGVSVVSVTSADGSCTAGVPGDADRPTRCTLGTMPPTGPASTKTVSVTVDVASSTTGLLHNDAAVSSDTLDPDNDDNSATWTTTVDTAAELTLAKAATPDPVIAGEVLSYQLTVGNDGPSDARDVVVVDQLDGDVAFESASVASNKGTCALVTGGATDAGFTDAVRCELADPLAPGATATIHTDVRVAASVPHEATVSNLATATSATPGDPASTGVSAPVETAADVAVDKEVNVFTGNSSTEVEYLVTVTNHGPSDAQDVVLFDDLPSVLTGGGKEKVILRFLTPGCDYTPTVDANDTHSVECDFGTLPAGDSRTIRIHIELKGNGSLENVATVMSTTFDPDESNNTATELTIIGGGGGGGGNQGGGNGGGNGNNGN